MVEAIRQGDVPGVQLRCRQALPISTESAWSWLTEPRRLSCWLADDARVDLRIDGLLLLKSADDKGAVWREEGRSLEIAPPGRWVLAFRRVDSDWGVATRLTLELPSRVHGCELSVFQEGFEHLPLSECLTIWEAYRRRWRAALDRLAQSVS